MYFNRPVCKINYRKNSDTKKFAVITLKFEQHDFTIEKGVQKMLME